MARSSTEYATKPAHSVCIMPPESIMLGTFGEVSSLEEFDSLFSDAILDDLCVLNARKRRNYGLKNTFVHVFRQKECTKSPENV